MKRSYKFRLYPTDSQVQILDQLLDTHRYLYNQALMQRRDAWRNEKKSITFYMQCKELTAQRAANANFRALNCASTQATFRRVDRTFRNFFRRVKAKQKPGYPRFKERDRFNSILFPVNGSGIVLNGTKLRIQGLEKHVKVRKYREIEGKIKTLSVKCEGDRWYLILSCDLGNREFVPNGKPPIGIDVGLESLLTTSEGEKVENPRFLKRSLPELRRANRSLARKRKGSNKRKIAKRRLRRVHAKVANRRRDFVHKASRMLVGRFGLIAVEKLQIQNMLRKGSNRSRRLARSISDAAWGMFLSATRYKAEEAGCGFVEVNPKGTSQECSGCGVEVRKELHERRHECPNCGLSLDRDHNAARNILLRATARTGPSSGETNLGLLHGEKSGPVLPWGRSGSP